MYGKNSALNPALNFQSTASSPRDHKKMSKKGGTRVGARRPSAGGGRYEVYLGMGTEATVGII